MAPTRPLHGASPTIAPETPAFGPHPDRRGFLKGAAFLLSAAGLALMPARPVQAATGRRRGLSFFGDLKYPEGFAHLDYVNLNAPKGGEVATQVASWGFNQNPTAFNTLNSYVLQGDGAAGMGLTSVTLMTGTLDTLDNLYGFLAEGVEVSEDGKTYRFFLREGATFHDGSPITAEDVVFSLEILKSDGHPNLALELGGVAEIVAEDAATVKVVYTPEASRSLPLTVAGGIPVFSKAWWQGRDFKASLSEAPLGSGLYRLKDFRFGNSIRFERVAGHWAENLPVLRGTTNFDIIRYDYYGDRTAGFEALKKGSTTFREEFSSRVWATGYDFPAVTDGRVRRDEVPDGTSAGTQGWYFNMRRPKFADPRVREALAMVFDFEWTNKNLMYGSYQRTTSFFENSEMKAEGEPSAAELVLMEPLRDKLPAEAFGPAFVPPVSDGSGRDRKLLRGAMDMLAAAGCVRAGDRWTTPAGEALAFEILDDDNVFEPHVMGYINALKLIGVPATYRVVDPAQYNARTRDFDFDVTALRFRLPDYPDSFIRQIYGSASAGQPGSRNLPGLADPGIDALLEIIIAAPSREEFIVACKVLDRVLRASHLWVPHWFKATRWLAYWDVYDRPEVVPPYGAASMDIWWLDRAKAEKIGKGI